VLQFEKDKGLKVLKTRDRHLATKRLIKYFQNASLVISLMVPLSELPPRALLATAVNTHCIWN